jgi:hypothetical protein
VIGAVLLAGALLWRFWTWQRRHSEALRVIGWVWEHGHERCAVDFEPMNVLGARFWLRHFQPFCYSMQRVVDDRLVPPAL